MNNIIFIFGDVDDMVVCGAEGLFGVLSANLLADQTGSRAQDWAVVHYFYCGSQLQPLPLPSLPLDQTIFTAHQLATFPRLVCMILQDQTIFIARPSLPSLPSLTGVCLESA